MLQPLSELGRRKAIMDSMYAARREIGGTKQAGKTRNDALGRQVCQ